MLFSASGSQTLLHNFHILISFSGCDGTRFCSVFPVLPWLLGREFSIMVGRNMTQTQILYITTIVTLYTHYTTIIVCSSFSYIVTSLFWSERTRGSKSKLTFRKRLQLLASLGSFTGRLLVQRPTNLVYAWSGRRLLSEHGVIRKWRPLDMSTLSTLDFWDFVVGTCGTTEEPFGYANWQWCLGVGGGDS